MREGDEFLTQRLQRRVLEVHPELSFYEMNRRRPVVEPKKTAAGRRLRMSLLERSWRRRVKELVESRPRGVGRDDILDAMAVCWTAERALEGRAITIPQRPPRDSRCLSIAIVR